MSVKVKSASWWLRNAFKRVEWQRKKRIREAGKHKCVPVLAGTVSRVTSGSERKFKALKRPVTMLRLYECKICGRDMKAPHA